MFIVSVMLYVTVHLLLSCTHRLAFPAYVRQREYKPAVISTLLICDRSALKRFQNTMCSTHRISCFYLLRYAESLLLPTRQIQSAKRRN